MPRDEPSPFVTISLSLEATNEGPELVRYTLTQKHHAQRVTLARTVGSETTEVTVPIEILRTWVQASGGTL